MGIFAAALLTITVLLVLAAEWPRLTSRFTADARASRARSRRKTELTLIEGEGEGVDDDFARSVRRDLENLPVLEEHDDSSHRR
jgi:hypothetical protein